MLYSIKLYIGITILVFVALSIFVLFISLMQPVYEAQLLNTTFTLLFHLPDATTATAIVPLASIYIYHYNYINLAVTKKFQI